MIGQKIIKIPSNGHCLLLAIKQSLDSDFQIQREEKNIAQKIWKEIKDRVNFYHEFTTLTPEQLMRCPQISFYEEEYIYTGSC